MIGQKYPVLDSRQKVSGRIRYAIDNEPPGTLHVAIFRSTEAHARLLSIDTSAAQAMPGVVATLTRDDFIALGLRPLFGPVIQDQPLLAMDRVRYIGEPVAAVAAIDKPSAERALETIVATYSPLPAIFSTTEALQADAPLLHDEEGDRAPGYSDIIINGRERNICNKFQLRKGLGKEGLAEADHVFEHTFSSPSVQHVSMEPHAAVAVFDDARLTVTTSSQTPYAIRDALAHMFDLSAAQVRVIVPPLGGGFGGKTFPKIEPLAAALALKTRRPVKVVIPREDEFVTNRKHAAEISLRTGVRNDGTIVAREVQAFFNAGAYTDISPRLVKNGGYGAVGPYRIPHVHVDSYAVYTNLPSAGAFRGYGVSQGAWAYESQMDIIAAQLGIDPIEIRRRNLLRNGDTFATGEELQDLHFDAVLTDADGGGSTLRSERAVAKNGRIRSGRGCAVIIKSTITPSTSRAAVKLDSDGSLQVLTSTVDMGQGAHTALAQIAAQELGTTTTSVNVVAPDTDSTPYDMSTSSSRSTSAMGAAVGQAAHDTRKELIRLAAEQFEISESDLEVADGSIRVRGNPAFAKSIGAVVRDSRRGSLGGQGLFMTDGGLDPLSGQGVASEHWHQGAVSADIDLDLGTGKITVRKLRASVYVGTVVNPVNARMQVEGSIAFGLGQALFEELIHEDGATINTNLSEYSMAGKDDLPEILEVSLLEHPNANEIHGLGETALPPVMAAIANAVADATGVRIYELPLTPSRVLHALDAKENND